MRLSERLRSALPPSGLLRSGPEPPGRALGPGGARVLIVAGVLAVAVACGYLWLARPRAEPDRAPPVAVSSVALVASAPSSPAGLLVHVLGKVRRPGLVTLPAGARVADAIRAAGGTRPGATTGALNLARPVVDGEQIPVGVAGASPLPLASGPAPPGAAPSDAPVNLNTATSDDLQRLPGVGPVLAARILAYRTEHGSFRSVDQLQEVSGIGPRRFADLKSQVRT
ncbi:ComEA family DNA-binding protein [Actinomadura rayongensis]|uniref:ComEA family DNA-binding protein n=1 Tax=Actinomadura rayongensis TaxID=1429076 RepID=A0A6I4W2M1_9ACTN|nr:ComEA family DNA-binding protein [Actinomadura rayongensis]MXQ63681.1 ComEA family DNA-binding protein [Actinomadura rayongensis]